MSYITKAIIYAKKFGIVKKNSHLCTRQKQKRRHCVPQNR